MTLEIGSVVEGTITGITNFGAFVELTNGKTGLVHISEVADTFVEDIRQFLREKDKIQVKILGINEKGKYDLSIKQVLKKNEESVSSSENQQQHQQQQHHQQHHHPQHHFKEKKKYGSSEELTFEDKLSKYLKESEERLLDLKRNTEAKRGRGRAR